MTCLDRKQERGKIVQVVMITANKGDNGSTRGTLVPLFSDNGDGVVSRGSSGDCLAELTCWVDLLG